MKGKPYKAEKQEEFSFFKLHYVLYLCGVLVLASLYIYLRPSSTSWNPVYADTPPSIPHILSPLLRPACFVNALPPSPNPLVTINQPVTTVLITGVAGFIGSHMALMLLEDKTHEYRVIGIDDLSRGHLHLITVIKNQVSQLPPERYFYFEQMSVGDEENVADLLIREKVDLVMHFAGFAYAGESVSFPLLYFQNTVSQTTGLLKAMQKAKIDRFVYSSSSATYGAVPSECQPTTEDYAQLPTSPYGLSKLQAEQQIIAYANQRGKDFSYVLLRYFNVIGADHPPGVSDDWQPRLGPVPKPELRKFGRVVDSAFDVILGITEYLSVFGTDYHDTEDGTAVRDYIHVSDLIDAHRRAMEVCTKGQRLVYNIGIGRGFTVKQLLGAVEAATGHPVKVKMGDRRAGDPSITMGDSTKLQHELKWSPRHTNLTAIVLDQWKWRTFFDKQLKKDAILD